MCFVFCFVEADDGEMEEDRVLHGRRSARHGDVVWLSGYIAALFCSQGSIAQFGCPAGRMRILFRLDFVDFGERRNGWSGRTRGRADEIFFALVSVTFCFRACSTVVRAFLVFFFLARVDTHMVTTRQAITSTSPFNFDQSPKTSLEPSLEPIAIAVSSAPEITQ
jgi:hypothetical protein